jgi:hypothetical protein
MYLLEMKAKQLSLVQAEIYRAAIEFGVFGFSLQCWWDTPYEKQKSAAQFSLCTPGGPMASTF